MDSRYTNMATAVRITAISERPRLLSVENPYGPTVPAAPPSTRSSSPSSDEMELVSETLPPSSSFISNQTTNPRYLPVRTHSSPGGVSMSGIPLITTYVPRPPLLRAPPSSPTSPCCSPTSFSPIRAAQPPNPRHLPPSTDYAYYATCYSDDAPPRPTRTTSASQRRPRPYADYRSDSQGSAYTDSSSTSSASSSSSTRKLSRSISKPNLIPSKKRRRVASASDDRGVDVAQYDDALEGSGSMSWFRKIWRE